MHIITQSDNLKKTLGMVVKSSRLLGYIFSRERLLLKPDKYALLIEEEVTKSLRK